MERGSYNEAERVFVHLTKEFPEFIDAHHHLALIKRNIGERTQAFLIWRNIVGFGLGLFPSNFYFGRDRLPWATLDNRPFLRAYHALGLEYLDRNEIERASMIFSNILDMNPNDNQGIRALQIDCYFRLRRPNNILTLLNGFPDDTMAETTYGKVLALYQLGDLKRAEKALETALQYLPKVAEEIIKKQHRPPKPAFHGFITHGGADQAYQYWKDQGIHWKQTEGSIEFIKGFVEKG
jgi:tetratricopeptide (TPR) repeat protein